jgi:GTPase involved in cell partitioning and DNA repair
LTIFFFQCIQEERARYVEEIEDLKRQIVSKECEQQQEKDKLEEQCQVLQARLVESETSFELRSTRLTESLKENVKHLRQAVHTVAVLLDGNQRSTMVFFTTF